MQKFVFVYFEDQFGVDLAFVVAAAVVGVFLGCC